MSAGPRSKPPELQNFRHVGYLGGGGFADVFLYEQRRPSRQVAIKVLLNPARNATASQAFDAEADLMARVSAHPYIVTIHEADVAPDGRPYLVMEYYSRPNLGTRARSGPLPVPEVLQLGVRLASAVETAHRMGVLHRDIKPANILVSSYGRPGLTDFGIAGATEGGADESHGISIPYAAPEVVSDQSPGDERSDIYSLAATLYALLASRSPFEVPNGDNVVHALAQRVLRGGPPPTGRIDVPESLELLLAQAMAKDPAHRPRSAAELGRALQGIERSLGLAPTELEIADDGDPGPGHEPGHEPGDAGDDGTRINRVQVIREPGPVDGGTAPRGTPAAAISGLPSDYAGMEAARADRTRAVAPSPRFEVPAAVPGPAPAPAPAPAVPIPAPPPPPGPRRWPIAVAGAAVVVIVGVAVGVALAGGGDDTPPATTRPVVDEGGLVFDAPPPTPEGVTITVEATTATVRWTPGRGGEDGDEYLVVRTDGPDLAPFDATTDTTLVFEVAEGERPCVRVSAQRGSSLSASPSLEACA